MLDLNLETKYDPFDERVGVKGYAPGPGTSMYNVQLQLEPINVLPSFFNSMNLLDLEGGMIVAPEFLNFEMKYFPLGLIDSMRG